MRFICSVLGSCGFVKVGRINISLSCQYSSYSVRIELKASRKRTLKSCLHCSSWLRQVIISGDLIMSNGGSSGISGITRSTFPRLCCARRETCRLVAMIQCLLMFPIVFSLLFASHHAEQFPDFGCNAMPPRPRYLRVAILKKLNQQFSFIA